MSVVPITCTRSAGCDMMHVAVLDRLQSAPGALGSRAALAGATVAVGVLTGVALAWSPFLAMGVALGIVLMVFALMQPLALVALMLMVGPMDLSILTGGFKSMFTEVGGLDMNGIRLIGMSGALALVVCSERRVAREIFRPAAFFYAALVALAAISLAYSPAVLDGSRLLLKLTYPLLVFLVVCGLAADRRLLDRLMDAVLIAAAAICLVLNPIYVAFFEFERVIGGWLRLGGVGTDKNMFSYYLVAALVMSFVRFTTRRQWRYLLLCSCCGVWLVLTISRAAFGALLLAMLAVGVTSAIVTRNWRALITAAVVAALVAIPFAPPVFERTFGFVPAPGELLGLLTQPRALFMAINWEGRLFFWPVVFQAFLASPVLGLGLGSSSFVLRVAFPGFWSDVVHSEFLRLLCDTGTVGVALLLAALAAWAVAALRAARLPDRTVREYALPAVGLIAGFVFISLTDNTLDHYGPYTQYLGFLSGGALAGALAVRRQAAAAGAGAGADVRPARLAGTLRPS